MKVLYAIQGTGNGHLSRAKEIIPVLQKYCSIDLLVSGYQTEVVLPYDVKYKYKGLSFIFGKKGAIDIWNTYIEANTSRLYKEINSLPVETYDFVLNDFEPVSAWACYRKKVPCVALSHQSALLDKNVPKPKVKDIFGKFILHNYAPFNVQYGLHFGRYGRNIYTPVIRKAIRELQTGNKNYYTVYLPSYSDKKLIKFLSDFSSIPWQVFSKSAKKKYIVDNVTVFPFSDKHYLTSLRYCEGLICGAGFEAPAEALFLGKKLLVVPMRAQYEQKCNATALKLMGVPVLKNIKENKREKILNWIESDYRIEVKYPDITENIIRLIFESHILNIVEKNEWKNKFSLKINKGNQSQISDNATSLIVDENQTDFSGRH